MRPVAVVTGAAGGIGRAVVLRLAQGGFDVCVVYRSNEAAAHEVATQVEKAGGAALTQRVDIRSKDEVEALARAVYARWEVVAALVNNAGVTRDRPFAAMSETDWGEVLETNLSGTYRVSRAFAMGFVRERAGRIVNVASIAGITGSPGQVNYCASKAGMMGMTRALAREFARYEVPVNCVAPGFIETEMVKAMSDKARGEALAKIPAQRFGRPEEVAELVYFLCNAPTFLTGQVYSVDGGQTA